MFQQTISLIKHILTSPSNQIQFLLILNWKGWSHPRHIVPFLLKSYEFTCVTRVSAFRVHWLRVIYEAVSFSRFYLKKKASKEHFEIILEYLSLPLKTKRMSFSVKRLEKHTMDPFHDSVTWYKITHAGTHVVQWDFQNKATRSSLPWPALHMLRKVIKSWCYSVWF